MTRSDIHIPDGERAIFRIGDEEVRVYSVDGELRLYTDNILIIFPWATNTIRVRVGTYQQQRAENTSRGEDK